MTTNQVSLNRIIVDAQTNFKNLLEKTLTLMERYNNAYGKDDGRTVFFANYYQLNVWLLTQFENFRDVVFTPTSTSVSKYPLLRTEENATQFKLQYDRINRASYCTVAIFDVENFLNSILNSIDKLLDEERKTQGFGDITSKLETSLNLKDDQLHILKVLARVRNSLHNNGYHTKDKFERVIRGKSYKFEKGKQVKFSGWDDLYVMFDELLDVIEEFILETTDVKKLAMIPHSSETYHDTP